jgi:hypothetical protein
MTEKVGPCRRICNINMENYTCRACGLSFPPPEPQKPEKKNKP